MAIYQSSRRCMLCCGWVDQPQWTKEYTTSKGYLIPWLLGLTSNIVFRKGEHIEIGRLQYQEQSYRQQSSILHTNGQYIDIRTNPSASFTPVDVFLVHVACEHLLRALSATVMTPYQLFKLCQALQPDQERRFQIEAERDLSGQ
jgi:hypothetical protein